MKILAFLLSLCCICPAIVAADLQRFEFTDRQMGMPLAGRALCREPSSSRTRGQAVFAKFSAINDIASDYKDDSEIMRLSKASPSPRVKPRQSAMTSRRCSHLAMSWRRKARALLI